MFSTLKIMWADNGYDGAPLARYAKAAAAITVEVVKRTAPHSFQVLRRRWVIERTFGWLMRYRRLARDYERRTDHAEAMIYWATIIIMTRRLARFETGTPAEPRWGAERARPGQPSRRCSQHELLYLQALRPDTGQHQDLGEAHGSCAKDHLLSGLGHDGRAVIARDSTPVARSPPGPPSRITLVTCAPRGGCPGWERPTSPSLDPGVHDRGPLPR